MNHTSNSSSAMQNHLNQAVNATAMHEHLIPAAKLSRAVIRVLLVDDSPLELLTLQRLLSRSTEIQVVGTAANGKIALEMVRELNPAVICTDWHMPVMDGLEFTRAVMDSFPRPILVVNISEEPGSPNIFRLLEAGAVDVYSKPTDLLNGDLDRLAQDLASKIRILAGVCVFRRRQSFVAAECSRHAVTPSKALPPSRMKIVVIGASTGGPQALRQILSKLPASFPLPVVCIQHIGSNFLSEMIAWIAEVCVLTVRKAVKGELPQPGIIYFAPADTHLEFDESHHFSLSLAALVNGHRPSVTATMRAAAHAFGAGCTGVLLTGMGCDGAEGMASISVAGGITIAQDEASSVVYGMPGEAVARGVVQHLLPLELIAPALINLLNPESALRNKSLIGLGG